ncbi:M4 family metallopeptidase [Spirosoma sp. BT702]|uniref:M4 family metallopeptidase n=1 Tax=Spirosoma profusum TaxID=2771354 RepID=A0A927ARJ9_9BACT|nr:M4 family metallopeptidase [Spirosoma profusum]MBD2699885.1 M4 family metallopeptidase [Spirosoma profusum]
MKPQLFLLTGLFVASATLAQQPESGFAQKRKTGAASSDLPQRLGATVVSPPTNKIGRQTMLGTSQNASSLEPMRLRVVRDATTNLPIFIERRVSPKTAINKGARLSAAAATSVTYQFMGQLRSLLKIENPESQFTVRQSETDDLGQMHLRLMQTHRGIPVLGAELVAHLTDGNVTTLNGRYQLVPETLSTTPKLNLTDASERALNDVRKTATVRSFGDNILKLKSSEGDLCVFMADNGEAKLAYQLTVRPNMLERWEYTIDAQTGEVLDKYNHTCSFAGPIKATGKDLNGATRTFQTYQHTNNTYYMVDASRAMFKSSTSKMPDNPVGALWTVDAKNTFGDKQEIYQITSANNTNWTPTAISAHYNAGIAYEYYLNTFKRNALNGNGETIVSIVNMPDDDGKAMDNAYWNGKVMAYGNGKLLKPLAGALDVAGHEMTHGVIQNTANLQYKNQSGAINESMADVFGAMIDRDDWKLGEDVATSQVLPSGALRDLSNPNQGGKAKDPNGYQPATMSQYDNTTEDNGGVHINSGIPNFAFFKFATAVGKDKAEKVYYQALTKYLVRTSQFLDLRLAVIKAAGDLYGATGAEVNAAKAAFDAVGILDGTQTNPGKQPDVPVANGQDLLLLTRTTDSRLYATTVGSQQLTVKSALALKHRPSVTDDGKFAYYVTTDKRIRAVSLTGTASETVISDETIWSNVAISKDGTKLAALTDAQDASVYVYSYAKKKWTQFKLYNPTYTEGVGTGDVKYADSFEWDFTGENIVYDAYNSLKNNTGDAVDYWDVGFINVWNNKTGDFAKGNIEKLFSGLEEGESIGNPSFSKNSPDIIAFDYVNENDNSYYVVATDISTGGLEGVYENNTLGFPSYSRLDNQLVFSTKSGSKENVSGIKLGTDKISPSGSVSLLYENTKWPVWYTQANRAIPTKTAQTITFDAISDRYFNQGDLPLKATCSSNLAVSFQVKSGPATLSGSTLRFTGVGVVTIRAFQNGNDQFSAATDVERSFNVLAVLGTEPAWSDALSVYPNPVGNTLNVELPSTERIEQVLIQGLTGATLLKPSIQPRQHSTTLDVGQLPKGLYILQIQTPNGATSRKVVKE